MDARLLEIVGRFVLEGGVTDIVPLGNGLINDTFRVRTDGPDDYVLQRINQGIFPRIRSVYCGTRLTTSRAGHVISCLKMGGPSSKAKYS